MRRDYEYEPRTCEPVRYSDFEPALKTAEELLLEAWDCRIPVDPIKIAGRYGVKVYAVTPPAELPGGGAVAGALEWGDGTPRILLDKNAGTKGKRFIVAYALGQLFRGCLPTDVRQIVYGYDDRKLCKWSVQGVKSERFVAELLMPEESLKRAIMAGYDSCRLEEMFGVQERLMLLRLGQLKII